MTPLDLADDAEAEEVIEQQRAEAEAHQSARATAVKDAIEGDVIIE